MIEKLFKVIIQKIDDIRFMSNHVEYARKLGVTVGKNCKLLCNVRQCFGNEPYLISLGDHVEVCDSVRFMPHDGGLWVFRDKYPKKAIYGPIIVGDNVFIGINCIILPGVKIGDNVVIGAGSVVTKDLSSNAVYAGVPAKRINELGDYLNKAKSKGLDIAKMPDKEKYSYLKESKPEWFFNGRE